MTTRYYNKKFNAQRAARAQHIDPATVRFIKTDRGWIWEPLPAAGTGGRRIPRHR
ncbi:MAG: hypothetical protein U1E43_07670 [Rhodospirillales bacterium]